MSHGLSCRYVRSTLSRRVDCRWIAAVGLAILALAIPAAQAAPIEYHYGGVITSADAGTSITPGTRFDGTFTYDPQTNPRGFGFENYTSYEFGTSSNWPALPAPDTSAMSLWVGNDSKYARQGGLNLSVNDVGVNNPTDPYPRTILDIHSYDTDHKLNIDLVLSNPNRGVFGSLDIPTSINLGDFPNATISVTARDTKDPTTYLNFQGTIDTLNPVNMVTTPEPAAIAMWLGLAASALAFQARSRRSV